VASRVTLETDIQYVRGVGPARAREFARLEIRTVGDLVEHFPFRHELRPKSQPIGTLELDKTATILGTLERVRTRGSYARRVLTANVVDGTGSCRVRWFNSPYLIDKLHHGQVVRLTGKFDVTDDRPCFTNPQTHLIDDCVDPFEDDRHHYEPVYSATAELPSRQIAKVVETVLDDVLAAVKDPLPDAIRRWRNLPPRRTAILRFHHPTSLDDVSVARKRLAYDELLLCQLAFQISRRRLSSGPPATPITTTTEIDRRIRQRFPFDLNTHIDLP